MAASDWSRNRDWTPAIAAAFDAKLRRARDKQSYLRIQASYLAERKPEVALGLIERYFELGDHFDMAQAYVDRSTALLAQGDVEGALVALGQALQRERERPNLRTQAWSDYAMLIVGDGRQERFDEVLSVLDENKDLITFPVDKFVWHAVRALIFESRGAMIEAKTAAEAALRLADVTFSGYRDHPHAGLVRDRYPTIRARLDRLARAGV